MHRDDPQPTPPRFEMLATVSRSRRATGVVVGLVAWYVALLIGAWAYFNSWIMQFALLLAAGGFLVGLVVLLLLRRSRLREVERAG